MDAGGPQLALDGAGEIEMRAALTDRPAEDLRVPGRRHYQLSDLGPDLVAAGADGGPDPGPGRLLAPREAVGCVRHDARIELIQPTGSRSYATFSLGGEPVMAELQAHDVSRPGEQVQLDINMQRASIFDSTSETAL